MFLIIFPYGYSITVFGQLQNNSLPPAISNSIGTFSIDKNEYGISVTKGDSVKTYGVVNNPHDAGRITISITLPDKSIQGYVIFVSASSGYFENHYPLDSSSQIGSYHVLATYNGDVIGTLDFTVKQVLLKQTPITNTTIVLHNQTNVKTLTNNTTPASNAKTINYIDTRLSLDYKESANKGYVSVYTTLTTNSGNLQSDIISILVDGQFKTHVSTEIWSSDILIGFGTHTIEAVYPLTSDLKDSSTIYKNSDAFKTIVIQQPTSNLTQIGGKMAVIDTKFGEIKFKLLDNVAPKTTENFISLANSGFYDKTVFHRIVPGFVIQGGDPNTIKGDRSTWGIGNAGLTIPPEFNSSLSFTKYTVGMARSQDVNSGSSQFFITLDATPNLNGQYTLFGEVISGQDVVDKIASLQTDPQSNQPVDADAARIDNISIQMLPSPQPTKVTNPPVSNTPPPQQQPTPAPAPAPTPIPSTVPNTQSISNTPATPNYTYVVLVIVGVIVSVIVFILVRKRKSSVTPITRTDDTQFYGCPNCGGDTVTKKSKQFCNRCNQYL